MNLIKVFAFFLNNYAIAQYVVGGQHDIHDCVSDGGYTWCESSSSCIRSWETPCSTELHPIDPIQQTNLCDNSPMQRCNQICPEIKCRSNECAIIQNSCCEYECISNYVLGNGDIPDNCVSWFDGCNTCSVTNGNIGGCTMMMCFTQSTPECQAYSINSIPVVNYSGENEQCGGYMPQSMIHECSPGLECVNIMGHMIADAPGKCKQLCPSDSPSRDQYGNCIDIDCRSWFDGCNNCLVGKNSQLDCNNNYCQQPINAQCTEYKQLNLNDICYQYCEHDSLATINKRDLCPTGSSCSSSQLSEISFDNCGSRAFRCVSGH